METPQDIDKLFTSLVAIEEQREVLGAAVDPLIEEIRTKILTETPEPTLEDRQVNDSWASVLATSRELQLAEPTPTPEIEAAVAAVERYDSVLVRLGAAGLGTAIEEPTPPYTEPQSATANKVSAAEPQAQSAPEPVPAASRLRKVRQPKSQTAERHETQPVGAVVIRGNNDEVKPKESIQDMYVSVLKALADSPEGVEITALLRSLTGGFSATEIRLMRNGTKEVPAGVDLESVQKINGQMYQAIKVLRSHNFIEHEPGSISRNKGEFGQNKSGIIRAFGTVAIDESPNGTVIELGIRPFHIEINNFDQTIGNGRGKKIELSKEEGAFLTVSRSLGAIAVRSESEHTKFRRSELTNWIKDRYGAEVSDEVDPVSLSWHLKSTIDMFEGDFPLRYGGIRGGGHFQWESGTPVDISDEPAEKIRFDDPIYVTISQESISINIDGENFTLIEYAKQHRSLLQRKGVAVEDIIERGRQLFETLSLLGPQDKISLNETYLMIHGSDDSPKMSQSAFDAWFRNVAKKMNELTDENLIHWANRNGILVDVNRRIIIEGKGVETEPAIDEAPDSTEEVSAANASTPTDHAEEMPNPAPEAGEGSVSRRKTAQQVIDGADKLPLNLRKTITGRLLVHGDFEYPGSLEEAAYLLQLLSNNSVLAQLRENGRFTRDGYSSFQNFVAEVLYASYIRTLSWGNFEDLITVISEMRSEDSSSFVIEQAQSFKRSTRQTLDEISPAIENRSKEQVDDRRFLDKALGQLIDGGTPRPRNPRQAIGLLELFRENRAAIAEGKTQLEFDNLLSIIHGHIAHILGASNMSAILASRTPRVVSGSGKAVQTASGEEGTLHRTDSHRFPDRSQRPRRRRRS